MYQAGNGPAGPPEVSATVAPVGSSSQPARSRRGRLLVSAFVPMLVGIAFVVFPVVLVRANQVDEGWRTTQGEVVDELASKTRRGTVLTQIVRYTVNVESYEVTRELGNTNNASMIGESMEVAYDPTRPSEAKVIEPLSAMWPSAAFFVAGLCLLAGSTFTTVRGFRRLAAPTT